MNSLASWDYITKEKKDLDELTRIFFNELFTLNPELKTTLFKSKDDVVGSAGKKMTSTLGAFSVGIDNLTPIMKMQMKNLVTLHRGNDVKKAEYFDQVGVAFLKSLEIYLKDLWTEELSTEWKEKYEKMRLVFWKMLEEEI